MKAQREPIQINKNGKPVAVVMSTEEYESIEALKLQLLKARAAQAKLDIAEGKLVDGEEFFDDLGRGSFDANISANDWSQIRPDRNSSVYARAVGWWSI